VFNLSSSGFLMDLGARFGRHPTRAGAEEKPILSAKIKGAGSDPAPFQACCLCFRLVSQGRIRASWCVPLRLDHAQP
jgi:hypothetical protein